VKGDEQYETGSSENWEFRLGNKGRASGRNGIGGKL
jgi:hypothetical protein